MRKTRNFVKVVADAIITITGVLVLASGIIYVGLGIITVLNN